MPGTFLTTAATVLCSHGGTATLLSSNARVRAGAAVLLESDVHLVAGCALSGATPPNPCVRIEWTAGAGSVKVGGTKALVQSSVGKCLNAAGAAQGVAIVVPGQFQARGR
jgi:hypothetical protein